MATVAQLRKRPHMRHAYLLLVDGCPFAFTDEYELSTASGSGWWTADDRVILSGLSVPNLTISLDWDSGLLEDNAVSFKVLDTDATTIPGFFGNAEKPYRLLGTRLTPGEDPAPANTIDQYGDALPLWDNAEGSYIGTEAIGPNGERHHYSCLPWISASWPGEDHGAIDDPLPVWSQEGAGPYLVEGRRVTLFRLVYDEDTQSWPSPQDQYEGGTLLWWGKLRSKGKVEGRTWTFSCSGPASWLVKTLNSRAPTEWFKVNASLELPEIQRKIFLRFYKKRRNDGYLFNFAEDLSYTISAGPIDIDQIVSDINTAISATKGATGTDGEWTDDDPNFGSAANVTFAAESVTVWTNGDADMAAIMSLGLHWSVWRALGYDPESGLGTHEGPQPQFTKNPLYPGYYFGSFSTTPFGSDVWAIDGDPGWDGDGVAHVYEPLYPGGLVVLPGTGQASIKLVKPDGGFDPIYCESQRIRPPVRTVQFGGLDCNSTRWWVFRGKIQRPTGLGEVGEPEDLYQVAKCSWVETAGEPGLIYQSNGLDADLYVEEWADPRLFGLNYKPVDPQTGWAGTQTTGEGSIYASPLAVWGVWTKQNPSTSRGTDDIGQALHRLLVSSGTSDLDGSATDEGDAALLPNWPLYSYVQLGDNQNPDADAIASDVEIADLGLSIPYQLVDYDGISEAAEKLYPSLKEGKLVAHGPVESEDLIQGILAPRDWALSLAGKKYGVFARSKLINTVTKYLDIEGDSISISDLAGEGGEPASTWPEAELRGTDPIDKITIKYSADPTEGAVEGAVEKQLKARDLGSRARAGKRSIEVQAPDLRAREWWTEGMAPVPDWSIDMAKLWEKDVSGYRAAPNRKLTLRISRPKGQDLYPGSVFSFSDPRPVNSTGSYGYTNAIARVLSVTHEADSCAAVVECLVQAVPPTLQVWAPISRVIDDVATPEERYDPATRTFYLQPWGSSYNARAWTEPVWSSAGGDARFWVLQYDGNSWTKTAEGTIADADPDNGTITHTDAGLVGTFYSRMYAVLVHAPYDDADQGDWPKAVFPILSPPNGLAESKKLK